MLRRFGCVHIFLKNLTITYMSIIPWEDRYEWHRMTIDRTAGPDCAIMCNFIRNSNKTYTHTHTHYIVNRVWTIFPLGRRESFIQGCGPRDTYTITPIEHSASGFVACPASTVVAPGQVLNYCDRYLQ